MKMNERRNVIHQGICTDIHLLYEKKNSDYGNSFVELRKEFPNSVLIRLTDKLNRLKALMKDGAEQKVADESIDDTLMDIANYAIMELTERKLETSDYVEIEEKADGLRDILEENASNNKMIDELHNRNIVETAETKTKPKDSWKKEVDIHTVVTSTYRPKYKNYRVMTTVIRNGEVVAQDGVNMTPEMYERYFGENHDA